MEKVDTTRFICEPFHSDFTGHLTMCVLGNHLLNCAGEHASRRGFGIARLNEEDHTWVLSRMAIEITALPSQYESFEIDTWVDCVYRLFTDRNFALRDKDGHEIGYARTTWAMIGIESRRPIELTSLYGGAVVDYAYPDRECPIEKGGRIKVSATAPSRSIITRYSDIDINGHVNSIRYIEHVMDLFPLDYLRSHRLVRFEIAYITEAYFGDQLDLYVDQNAGDWQVEVRRADTPICRCRLVFA